MKAKEKKQRLEQIEAFAKALIQGVRIMDERRHILQPLLQDDDIQTALDEKFRNTFGAHAYNHLVPLLAQDLVRDLARLYLDDDRKAGSFANLYRKASDRKLHAALREQFCRIPDKWHEEPGLIPGLTEEQTEEIHDRWRDKDREDFGKSFDNGWAIATTAITKLAKDPVAEKIKTFRDKYYAHLEIAPLGSDPGPFDIAELGLRYNDILEFSDCYMPALFELVRILTGSVHDVEGFIKVHRRHGHDMWRIFAGLPEIKIMQATSEARAPDDGH